MLFFNPFALAQALRQNALDQNALFRLFIVGFCFQFVDSFLGVLAVSSPGMNHALAHLFDYSVIFAGATVAYRNNKRGDNRNFIERWIILSVPLWWWVRTVPYALDISLYRFIYAHYGLSGGAIIQNITPYRNAWVMGRYIFFYAALCFLIRIAASGPTPSTASSPEFVPAPIAAP